MSKEFLDKSGLSYYNSKIQNELNNKANSSDIPTKTSDLTNDSGYINADNIPSEVIIGNQEPTTDDWKIWIDSDEVQNLGSEVVDNLEYSGDKTKFAPSINAVSNALDTKADTSTVPTSTSIVDLIYPVGAIYMSVNSTNPGILFGGTWEQIKDKFILSAGDTYAGATTGGSASHTLTTAELPGHTHTYDKSATTSGSTTLTAAQSGVPAHSHNYSKSATATGAASGNTGSTTLTAAQSGLVAHKHVQKDISWVDGTGWLTYNSPSYYGTSTSNGSTTNNVSAANASSGHTHSLNNHTHSITLTSTASSNNTAANASSGHTHSITLTSTNSGSTGSGTAFSTLPPYLAVYVWERTA